MSEYELSKKEADSLTAWFDKNKRDLPWRGTGDPYDVWLSEIMLQQTRVEAVKEKFIQFRRELPDIISLSEVSDDRLMKLWEGMGYYSRARNLKKCAGELRDLYGGVLPSSFDELIRLSGIGPYTAGAIVSIAYGNPVPAVDGNVLRVLARLFEDATDIRSGRAKKNCGEIIRSFYRKNPGLGADYISSFTQALMELGALVCVPNGQPHCEACPWNNVCRAHLNNTAGRIPYRSALKGRRIEERTLLIIRDEDRFLLRKRPESGLLAGLYEFAGYDGFLSRAQIIEETEKLGISALHIRRLPDSRHIFTHLEWHMHAFEIMVADIDSVPDGLLLTKKELAEFAVPSAFSKYISYYSLKD